MNANIYIIYMLYISYYGPVIYILDGYNWIMQLKKYIKSGNYLCPVKRK